MFRHFVRRCGRLSAKLIHLLINPTYSNLLFFFFLRQLKAFFSGYQNETKSRVKKIKKNTNESTTKPSLFVFLVTSEAVTATQPTYCGIIKKPAERLGSSHTWGGSDGSPKRNFSNLPNMERLPHPITWPRSARLPQIQGSSSGVQHGGRGEGGGPTIGLSEVGSAPGAPPGRPVGESGVMTNPFYKFIWCHEA